jgi:hypothetical protein
VSSLYFFPKASIVVYQVPVIIGLEMGLFKIIDAWDLV